MLRSATSSDLHGRLASAVLWTCVALAPNHASATPAVARSESAVPQGKVYLTLDEALHLAFKDCAIERSTAYLSEDQKKRAGELAGDELSSAIVHPYKATKDGVLVGTAYLDTHRVRTLRESVLVVVDAQDRVQRVELLAFAEPPEYAPRGAWYGQFVGKRLDDELNLKRGIRGIAGASLTARATTSAVRRVLATHAVLKPVPPPRTETPKGTAAPRTSK